MSIPGLQNSLGSLSQVTVQSREVFFHRKEVMGKVFICFLHCSSAKSNAGLHFLYQLTVKQGISALLEICLGFFPVRGDS